MDFTNLDPSTRVLGELDYQEAAQRLQCEVAVIQAVCAVEAGSDGYLSDGRPKILFEAHYFGKLTNYQYNGLYPNISTSNWDRALYGAAGAHQYDRLTQAIALDESAALRSASWGYFQILGDNFATCNFTSPQEFVASQVVSAKNQLLTFCNFIIANSLADELQDKRWADFARIYNGPGYAQNQYDVKLQQDYLQLVHGFSGRVGQANQPLTMDRQLVMQAQSVLNGSGYANPLLTVDGWLGPRTIAAIKLFQSNNGLPTSGQIDTLTRQTLGI